MQVVITTVLLDAEFDPLSLIESRRGQLLPDTSLSRLSVVSSDSALATD